MNVIGNLNQTSLPFSPKLINSIKFSLDPASPLIRTKAAMVILAK